MLLPQPAEFLDSLLLGRSSDVIAWVLDCVVAGASVTSVHRDLVIPTLYEIGDRWERGVISVADEHYCAAALHSLLARLHPYLPRAESHGRRVAVVGVIGNMHALSLHMLADQYEMDGWEATLIGTDTPAADIVTTARRLRTDVVALGASLDTHLPAVLEAIRALRAAPDLEGMRIVVGGRATAGWDLRELRCDAMLGELWNAPAQTRKLFAITRPTRNPVTRPPVGNQPLRPTGSIAALSVDNAVRERALSVRNNELRHADDAKNRLIGMAAHELRTPLTVVLAGLELIGDEVTDPSDDMRETLADMRTSVERMKLLVQDLLDVTHAEARSVSLALGPVALDDLVDSAIAGAESVATAKQTKIHYHHSAMPTVHADAHRIRQVLDNYLTNALKFSPPGSAIHVRVSVDGEMARVSVIDAGPGVPAAERDRLFKPFSRTSVRPTAGEASTGLGLAIVARIINAHCGQVGMRDAAGGGSEFFFTLPLAAAAHAAA